VSLSLRTSDDPALPAASLPATAGRGCRRQLKTEQGAATEF
jgi:hypothetical protein